MPDDVTACPYPSLAGLEAAVLAAELEQAVLAEAAP